MEYPGDIKLGGEIQMRALKDLKTSMGTLYKEAHQEVRPLILVRDNTNPHRRLYRFNPDCMDSNKKAIFLNKKSIPIFGEDFEKVESVRMLAALEASLSDGRCLKFLTVSGGSPIRVRQFFEIKNCDLTDPSGDKKQFELMSLKTNGYELKNVGEDLLKDNIINLKTGKRTDKNYTTTCAAQKALWMVSKEVEARTGLTVKNIKMTEVMWSPTKDITFKANESCHPCKEIIPLIFPKN